MIKETITRIKLTAADGMVLTDGESYGKEIFLSQNGNADNWQEITEEEYKAFTAEIWDVENAD